jgi:hypothetical protein
VRENGERGEKEQGKEKKGEEVKNSKKRDGLHEVGKWRRGSTKMSFAQMF